MNRQEALKKLLERYHYNKLFLRLNKAEQAYLFNFMDTYSHLDEQAYISQVNKICLSEDRPKKWAIIDEILSCVKI